jgi:Chaperone of endosialidase
MDKIISCFFLCIFYAVSSAQNIGIGTTSPTRAKLEVHGAESFTSAIFGGETTGISLQSNLPAIGFNQYYNNGYRYMADGYAAVQYLDPANGLMALDFLGYGTANNSATSFRRCFTIASNGNIGLGTLPSNASLFAVKGSNFDGSAVFGGSQYNSHFHYGTEQSTYIRGGITGSKVFINDITGGKIIMGNGNGYVGINNGVPTYPLEIRQVNGRGLLLVEPNNNFNNWEMRVVGWPESGSQSNLNLVYNGQAKGYFVWGTGEYRTYSDRRLKNHIFPLSTITDKFMQLEPVEYEMKDHNTTHEKIFGFIAQDVKRSFPELVAVSGDTIKSYGLTDLHGLNYNGFNAITIKVLQEQQQLIRQMQEENQALRKRILSAEALINSKK